MGYIYLYKKIGLSYNGITPGFGPGNRGSTPLNPTRLLPWESIVFFIVLRILDAAVRENSSIFLFNRIFINQKNVLGMDKNFIETEKLGISYNEYEKEYTISIYDTYGHFIDDVKLSREEMKYLYDGLDKIKENFINV